MAGNAVDHYHVALAAELLYQPLGTHARPFALVDHHVRDTRGGDLLVNRNYRYPSTLGLADHLVEGGSVVGVDDDPVHPAVDEVSHLLDLALRVDVRALYY